MIRRTTRRVAILVETSNAYGREIQLGIADHAREGGRWSMFAEQHELGAPPPPWLLRQAWDGIISRPTTPPLARTFRRMRVPVVDLNDLHRDLGFPRLQSDNRAIGRLAADHLRERGFTRFAYCGFTAEPWAAERRDGFLAAVRPAAVACHETRWRGEGVLPWAAEQAGMAAWLAALPRPVGIFACNDARARHVLEACRSVGLAVPDVAAVVGVDDDELLCRMCDPPLSSVVPDAHRIGVEAARLLDRLMSGRAAPTSVRRVAPRAVVTRRSTDTLAVADADVAAALRFIRDHACDGIGVADVLGQVPLSRSLLDRRFHDCLGRSPHTEIRAVQLRQATRLLEETDLPLKQVAARCGLAGMEYLSYLFKRTFGTSPGSYRRTHARQARPRQAGR